MCFSLYVVCFVMYGLGYCGQARQHGKIRYGATQHHGTVLVRSGFGLSVCLMFGLSSVSVSALAVGCCIRYSYVLTLALVLSIDCWLPESVITNLCLAVA